MELKVLILLRCARGPHQGHVDVEMEIQELTSSTHRGLNSLSRVNKSRASAFLCCALD